MDGRMRMMRLVRVVVEKEKCMSGFVNLSIENVKNNYKKATLLKAFP